MVSVTPSTSIHKICRRGKKLTVFDDTRMLGSLPKDVAERTWAEILQRDENDLFIFDIREEIIESALNIVYEKYMERQLAAFNSHCAVLAWMKLIDWHFYRHDPGEDPTAYPPCYIPKRAESWVPDEIPDPSPKDTWARHSLNVIMCDQDEEIRKVPTKHSLDYPIVEEIPKEYWFPGKVNIPVEVVPEKTLSEILDETQTEYNMIAGTESEVLQKITDYSTKAESKVSLTSTRSSSALRLAPLEGSMHGAGDSPLPPQKKKEKQESKTFSSRKLSTASKIKTSRLLPIGSRSHLSIISDCRLRNLRLDTNYEISSEKTDSPPTTSKKKTTLKL